MPPTYLMRRRSLLSLNPFIAPFGCLVAVEKVIKSWLRLTLDHIPISGIHPNGEVVGSSLGTPLINPRDAGVFPV